MALVNIWSFAAKNWSCKRTKQSRDESTGRGIDEVNLPTLEIRNSIDPSRCRRFVPQHWMPPPETADGWFGSVNLWNSGRLLFLPVYDNDFALKKRTLTMMDGDDTPFVAGQKKLHFMTRTCWTKSRCSVVPVLLFEKWSCSDVIRRKQKFNTTSPLWLSLAQSFLHSSCLGCLSSQLEIKKWLCSAALTLGGAETTAGTETASRLLGSTIFH